MPAQRRMHRDINCDGKCVWAMSWSILMQTGWGTWLDFVGKRKQLKKMSGKNQSGRNVKGPGRDDKVLPWHEGVREPIKSYREQGQQQSGRLREHFSLLPNSYHDMKWTWTRNLSMRCSHPSLFCGWIYLLNATKHERYFKIVWMEGRPASNSSEFYAFYHVVFPVCIHLLSISY